MKAAARFQGKGGGQSSVHKKLWAKKIGAYYYYSLILGNFNPIVANQIFDNPADVIAEAYVSKMAYEYVEVK